jgi:hypothetical protein
MPAGYVGLSDHTGNNSASMQHSRSSRVTLQYSDCAAGVFLCADPDGNVTLSRCRLDRQESFIAIDVDRP